MVMSEYIRRPDATLCSMAVKSRTYTYITYLQTASDAPLRHQNDDRTTGQLEEVCVGAGQISQNLEADLPFGRTENNTQL